MSLRNWTARWILTAAVVSLAGSAAVAQVVPDTTARPAPADMTVPQLEERYGKNVLVPDPAGLGPPPEAVRAAEARTEPRVLHRWYGAAPSGLNPLLVSDANLSDSLVAHVAMGPAVPHQADPNVWAPGVADYAGISDDSRVVTVRLKRGVQWQFPAVDREDPKYRWLVDRFETDPPELTADDFLFTHTTTLNEDVPAGAYRSFLEGTELRVLDRYTYQLVWDRFYVYALDFALYWQAILPRFLYSCDEDGRRFTPDEFADGFNNHWYNNRLCGYGPYEFARMDPDERIVLKRREGFPVMRPAFDELHWHILRDAEQCVLQLKDGQLDHIVLMPQQYQTYYAEAAADSPFRNGEIQTKPYEKMEYYYLGWNNRRRPFDDTRVRRAMSMAFNREAILEKIYHGFGALVDSHVFYKHPHFNSNIEPIRFDLEAASELLDEAGWGDEDGDGVRDQRFDGKKVDFSFTMKTFGGSAEFEAVTSIFQSDLESIGVDMKVVAIPWPQLRVQLFVDRDFDAYTGAWGLGWRLDFYQTWHSDGIEDGSNHVGFSDAEADELIVRYRETVDDGERRKLAHRIQEIIHREQPYTFFLRRDRLTAFQPWLQGVEYGVIRPQLLNYRWYPAN